MRSSCRPTPSTSAASRSTFPARARATSRPGRTRPRATPTRSPPSSAPSGSSRPTSRASRSAPAVAMHLAARHPGRVRSLSLHSAWDTSDLYLKTVVELWRTLASSLPTVADTVIQAHLPAVLHARDVRRAGRSSSDTLADFVRSRPAQPLDAFLAQTEAAIAHDVSPVLGEIGVPTPDHRRSARPRLLAALRRADQQQDRRQRAGGLRASVARRAARGPRDLQPRDARLPAAPALVTAHAAFAVATTSRRRPRRAYERASAQGMRPPDVPLTGDSLDLVP